MKNKIIACLAAVFVLASLSYAAQLVPGTKAAGFVLQDLEGKRVSLNTLLSDNKPHVISFFATWCKPCLKEIPILQSLKDKKGLNVTLVSIDSITKEALKGYLNKNKISLPVLMDPDAAITGNNYGYYSGGRASIPMLVLLSGTGEVKYVEKGYNENLEAELEDKLLAMSQEKKNGNTDLAIFFTNSTNGYLESCDCPSNPFGGLVRRAYYLRSERAKYPNNLLLDSGDMFSPYIAPKLAAAVMTLYERIGYDAVGVGDQELSLEGFAQEMAKYKIPFLASNISFCTGNQCQQLTPKTYSFERSGLKISVLSLIDPEVFALYPEKITEKFSIIPMDGVISGFLEDQKDKSDLQILISHCGFDADKLLAEKYPDLDIIVGGHSQTAISQAYQSGKTIIVQAGENAQNVGKLVLKINGKKQVESFISELMPLTKDIPEDPGARKLVNEYKAKKRR